MRSAPCATLGYATLKVVGARNVIRITGGNLEAEAQPISITTSVIFDGTGTVVWKPASAVPWLTTSVFGTATIEGLIVRGNSNPDDPTIDVKTGLHLARGAVMRGAINSTNATLILRDATLEAPLVLSGGTLDARTSSFSSVASGNSQVSISRSRFDSDGPLLTSTGGMLNIENNLFVQADELADSIYIMNVVPGSRFRFNTVVTTSGVDSDGKALDCDASLLVESSIFAHRSRHPHGYLTGCQTRFCLYDDVVVAIPTAPVSSEMGDIGSFFVSLAGKDFHLGAASPAREHANPASPPAEDYEGNARPSTMGSVPDIGAYEAP